MKQRAILKGFGDFRDGLIVNITIDGAAMCYVESPGFKGSVGKENITYIIDGPKAAKRKEK